MNLKIISGGQTGVDRAALDYARQNNIPCGGFCPAGRKAEDGIIPMHYPLIELESSDYRVRTKKNIRQAAGTVIFAFGEIIGGTRLTLQYCKSENKPYLLIDANETDPNQAGLMISEFIGQLQDKTINIAGPRLSKVPKGYAYAIDSLSYLEQLDTNH